jgi:hypothetical protein
LNILEKHFIVGFGAGGEEPEKEINLLPGAYETGLKFLAQANETQERFERVMQLVEGFETPYGMELLSTVHWVAVSEGGQDIDTIINHVQVWSPRKRDTMKPEHIKVAWKRLEEQQWI